jgi:thiol-disulfide isomerase/thioredoxin
MSLTPSDMIPLGSVAPEFTLPECDGSMVSLEEIAKGRAATVVMFICNHCPFVHHIEPALVSLANDYKLKQVGFVAINANDVDAYPEDSLPNMQLKKKEVGYPFPYLFDESQEVAKAYQAACTPDFFIFDKDLKCVYRGRLDDSRPGNDIPVTGVDLRVSLDAVLSDQPVSKEQYPSMGCNIKWREESSSSN